MAVLVRAATRRDVNLLMALRRAAATERVWIGAELPLDEPADRSTLESAIRDDDAAVFVAEMGELIVGSLMIHERRGIASFGMQIAEGHRGAGIGARLLEHAVDWARQREAHKICIEMWPWNHRAKRLYERFGFEEEGYRRRQYRRKDGSLWDSVEMGLVLDEGAPGHLERAGDPPPPLS